MLKGRFEPTGDDEECIEIAGEVAGRHFPQCAADKQNADFPRAEWTRST
jgi:hypothetical protein